MLTNIKTLLGLTTSDKDEILLILIDQALQFVKNYIHDDCICGLDGVISNIVVYNYNRLGTEGLGSESYSGLSFNYTSEFPDFIIAQLKPRRKLKVY